MARFSDVITLISLLPAEEETNENGFNTPATETRRDVFANRCSVGFNEFYQAAKAGYTTEIKFKVYTAEYEQESIVEYAGHRYKVLRTYESKAGEFTELTLSDLAEGGEADG